MVFGPCQLGCLSSAEYRGFESCLRQLIFIFSLPQVSVFLSFFPSQVSSCIHIHVAGFLYQWQTLSYMYMYMYYLGSPFRILGQNACILYRIWCSMIYMDVFQKIKFHGLLVQNVCMYMYVCKHFIKIITACLFL